MIDSSLQICKPVPIRDPMPCDAMSNSVQRDWLAYYTAVTGRPPRETLLFALDRFEAPGFAVDLGCGDGRDTVELLRRGWQVLGIDGEVQAIERLVNRPDLQGEGLQTQVARFESLSLPPNVDLINASFCLHFCPSAHFLELWEKIGMALRSGGRFAGHLIGERDSWALKPEISFHTRAQIEQLLAPFAVEYLEEEEHPGTTPLGEEKHWHLFHLVIRKIGI